MKILTVANQKGGVGKTTLAVHLAYAAVEQGSKVLLVDFDLQGNLSLTFDHVPLVAEGLTASVLFGEDTPDVLRGMHSELRPGPMALIPADNELINVEKEDNGVLTNPAQALQQLTGLYDLCIIDTPPTLGNVLMGALTAANFVVTPVAVGLYELAGVEKLNSTFRAVRSNGLNPQLKHIGIVPMKTTSRSPAVVEALASLRSEYGDAVLPVELRERVSVRAAIASGKPVWYRTKGSGHLAAAREWKAACSEILRRIH